MLEWDERMPRWAAVGEQGWTLRAEGHGRGSVLSVGQGLIELEFGKGLRISGIESGRLIESELGLRWGAGRSEERSPTGKIETGQDGVDGRWIGDEGDDTHGSAARRADEWEDVIDPSDEGCPSRGSTAAWCGSVRRTRDRLRVELRWRRLLYATLLTPERDDLIPELGIGSHTP